MSITPEELANFRWKAQQEYPNFGCRQAQKLMAYLDKMIARAETAESGLDAAYMLGRHEASTEVEQLESELSSLHIANTVRLAKLKIMRQRAKQAEAERDWIAEKLADISDKMNRAVDRETVFCRACGICSEDGDDLEGYTCLDAILDAARQASAADESEEK